MIYWIIAVQVIVYLALSLIDLVCTLVSPLRWWHVGSFLSFHPELSYLASHPWSLVTYILPHDSLLHLIGNMLLLWVLQRPVEPRLNPHRTIVLYLYGAVAGALGYLAGYYVGGSLGLFILLPLELMGASSAILTLLTATLILRYRGRTQGTASSTQDKSLWIALGLILLWGLLSYRNIGGHLAHAGGIACGVLFALLLRRGIDMTAPLVRLIQRASPNRPTPPTSPELPLPLSPEEETILKKLRHSGYGSLTEVERAKLRLIGERTAHQS